MHKPCSSAAVVQSPKQTLRDRDVLARYGEFMLVMWAHRTSAVSCQSWVIQALISNLVQPPQLSDWLSLSQTQTGVCSSPLLSEPWQRQPTSSCRSGQPSWILVAVAGPWLEHAQPASLDPTSSNWDCPCWPTSSCMSGQPSWVLVAGLGNGLIMCSRPAPTPMSEHELL